MTDAELVESLLRLSESDRLTDEESDAVALAARIMIKRKAKKEQMLAELRRTLHSMGEL